jgi:hypothetical protein
MDIGKYRAQLAAHWNTRWAPSEAMWRSVYPGRDIREHRAMNLPNPCHFATQLTLEDIVNRVRSGDMINAIDLMDMRVRDHLENSEFTRREHLADHDLILSTLDKINSLQRARVDLPPSYEEATR